MAPFQVDIDNQESCILVTVTGELDISTAPQLEQALAENTGESDLPLVVDLNSLDFIDSTGLSVLVRSYKRLDESGRAFSIVCAPDKLEVQRVLEILGFNEVFTIHTSLAEAGCGDQTRAG